MTTNGQYPPKVCKRLDAIAAERDGRTQREKELVNNRKALWGEWAELGPGETAQHKNIALQLVGTLMEIDHQRAKIKELADKLTETVRNAHQEHLFDDGDEPESKIVPTQQELFEGLKRATKEEKPSDPDERDETPDEADPGVADGEDQHLAASVNELDIPENVRDKCIRRGWTTVGVIAGYYNDGADIRSLVDLNENQEATLRRAVKAYCKTHEKAKTGKFKGEENGPRVDHRKSRGERIGTGAKKTTGKKTTSKK